MLPRPPTPPTLELDRNSGTPLHSQLFEHYRWLIEAGKLPVGGRLPTEMALMDLHGLSRGTVRQALKSLSDAGLVRREPKNGTVVSPPRAAREPASSIIGVIFPEARDAFCMEIMKGVQAACREQGFHAAFGYSHEDSALERTEVTRMRQAGFGGVLVLPHDDPALFSELAAGGYPFVYLDQAHAAAPGDFVGVDNVSASFGATAHLLGLGYERIAFLHHNRDLSTAPSTVRDRFRGYREALEAFGRRYDPAWQISTITGPDYLEQLRTVQAVAAVNDAVALELMDAAAEAGRTVPADLAVVGFDDLPQAAGYSLTTVAQPGFEIGRQAAELLIGRLGGFAGPPQRILLPTRLVVRGSSRAG